MNVEKPILLVSVPITDMQLEELSQKAVDYQVVKVLDLQSDISKIEIMYGWDKRIGEEILLSQNSQLKWVQAQSAGVDHIDVKELEKRGVILTNASGVHGNQMSESILGMIFAHTRNIKEAILNQEKSAWVKPDGASDLFGKTVMIVGTGHIGERLAEILRVFGTNIIGVNRSGREVPGFEEILKQGEISQKISEADIIVNLLPDTEETHYFFSDKLFKEMKDGVIFINAGRGGTVNTEALIESCQNDKIAFAGLDVFETEPLPSESPLWKLDNVLITPHTSGMSDQYYQRLFPIFVTNLSEFILKGKVVQNQIR